LVGGQDVSEQQPVWLCCIAWGKRTPVIETNPWWSWLEADSDSVYLLVPNAASYWETDDTRDSEIRR